MRTHHHPRPLRRLVVAALVPALCLFIAPAASAAPAAQRSPQTSAPTASRVGASALPVTFARNDGQAPAGVRYLGGVPGLGVAFTDTGVTLNLTPTRSQHASPNTPAPAAATPTSVSLRFVGADPHPTVTGTDRAPGVINDFHGANPAHWHTNIPTYKQVVYHDLWPGIDATFRARHGTLKYSFTLAPRADPDTIQLSYAGADHLTLDDDGDLAITTGKTVLQDHAPVSYQHTDSGGRQHVTTGYRLLSGTTFGFTLARHATGPLTIDPGLDYGTFLNATDGSSSAAFAVGHDARGNLYLFGAAGAAYPTTPGSYQPTGSPGTATMVVTKLDPTGSRLIYSTFVGGSGDDTAGDGLVASDGSVYVTGQTSSTDFPTSTSAYERTPSPLAAPGSFQAVAFRLDPTGSQLLFGTYLAPNFVPNPGFHNIAVGPDGSVTIAGDTSSDYLPTTPGAFQTTYPGGLQTGYVMRLNATGSDLLFATYLGTPITDQVTKFGLANSGSGVLTVAVDSTGASYLIGGGARGFPTTTGPQPTASHATLLIKLDPTGEKLNYVALIGADGRASGADLAIDEAGNAYVAGYGPRGSVATTPDAYQSQCVAAICSAVIKYGPTGDVVYASLFGGTSGATFATGGMAIDADGRMYIAGRTTRGSNLPVTPDALSTTQGDFAVPWFVAVLGKGTLDYSTYFGGTGSALGGIAAVGGIGIAPDVSSHTLYLGGSTNARDFPTTPGAFQPAYPGGFNSAWAAKLTLPALPSN